MTLAIGVVIGLINGFLVVKVKLDPFIVTLAMLILLRGITLGVSQGKTLAGLPEAFRYVGSARWAGIPAAIWITGILFLVAGWSSGTPRGAARSTPSAGTRTRRGPPASGWMPC